MLNYLPYVRNCFHHCIFLCVYVLETLSGKVDILFSSQEKGRKREIKIRPDGDDC